MLAIIAKNCDGTPDVVGVTEIGWVLVDPTYVEVNGAPTEDRVWNVCITSWLGEQWVSSDIPTEEMANRVMCESLASPEQIVDLDATVSVVTGQEPVAMVAPAPRFVLVRNGYGRLIAIPFSDIIDMKVFDDNTDEDGHVTDTTTWWVGIELRSDGEYYHSDDLPTEEAANRVIQTLTTSTAPVSDLAELVAAEIRGA